MPPPAAVCPRKLVAGIRIRIFLGQQIQKKLSKLKPKSWLEGPKRGFNCICKTLNPSAPSPSPGEYTVNSFQAPVFGIVLELLLVLR
mmetsp:Transcript_62286/g.117203  ORF Transcript_62286/g.117203 Transcript_62286/m.117203 type:complete len:87 (+) Transcript_62286:810-1070(+)